MITPSSSPFRCACLLTIARLTLLETWRNRLPWAVLWLVALGWGLAAFLNEAAVTESVEMQSALLGALFRLEAVFLVSVTAIAGAAREFQDRLLELLLALPMPRVVHFLGRLAGYSLAAALVAAVFGAALLPFVPVEQAVLWTLSLLGELILMTALGLVLVLTLSQLPLALTVAMAFYLLARSIGALILMAAGPLPGHTSLIGQWEGTLLTVLSWLLPDLERFTPTAWLVYHTGHWQELGSILLETVVYLLFIMGVGLFDLYRKNY
ncbi:MAG: ABC transporter permease [Magnetococcales bacterium]|nr:ABC transporter permease [Magnetococcales bacterium]